MSQTATLEPGWLITFISVCVYDFKVQSKRGADGTEGFRLSQHHMTLKKRWQSTVRRHRHVRHSSSVNVLITKALTFRHHASYIYDRRTATPQSTLFIY